MAERSTSKHDAAKASGAQETVSADSALREVVGLSSQLGHAVLVIDEGRVVATVKATSARGALDAIISSTPGLAECIEIASPSS